MRRRFLPHVCMLITLLAWSPVAAANPAPSWAQAELKAVVAAGLMAKEAAARPNDPLTRAELETLTAGLLHVPRATSSTPAATVSINGLDSRLVATLGLGETAKLFQQSAKSAGVAPPSRFGTEAVARLIGLRTNHPAALDTLELSPSESATHAEAAYSTARILHFGEWDVPGVEELAPTFTLPALTPWQKQLLTTAVKFIGYPYVWGGESETTVSPYGPQAHGGFDCSGFVWRVYKLTAYPGEGNLADVLRGRTTMEMSGEVPRATRIGIAALEPGDVMFFGHGRRSKPAQVDHTAIYLGNGWLVQSSGDGVTLAPFDGWYRSSFAWARRPLAEAGLA